MTSSRSARLTVVVLTSVVTALAPGAATAAGRGGEVEWLVRDDLYGSSQGAHVAVSPDGAVVYIRGSTTGMRLIARDAQTGANIWIAKTSSGFAADMTLSPDGSRVLLAGYVNIGVVSNLVTVSFDASNGHILWAKQFSPGPGKSAGGDDTAIVTDGARVFVTSAFQGGDTYWDFGTVAYDAGNGQFLWSATYPGEGVSNDIPYGGITLRPSGDLVFVTGTSGPLGCGDFATVAYSTADGSQAWLTKEDSGSCDFSQAIAPSPDGGLVYITGYDAGGGRTAAYDAESGALVASALSPGPGADVIVSPDGSRVYVTGAKTIAYDALLTGQLWSASLPKFSALTEALSPDSTRLYVGGSVDSGHTCDEGINSYDYATIAFDASTGIIQWKAHWAGREQRSPDFITTVVVSPDGGSVFVSGNADTCSLDDVATIAYQA